MSAESEPITNLPLQFDFYNHGYLALIPTGLPSQGLTPCQPPVIVGSI